MKAITKTSRQTATWLLIIATITASASGFAEDAKNVPVAVQDARKLAAEKLSKAFSSADRNSDGKLTLEEFLVDRGRADVAKRDFLLFDADGDDLLTSEEFSTLPTIIDAEHRGPLPDPMQSLTDQVMSALDKSLNNWNDNPKVEVETSAFVRAISSRFAKYSPRFNANEADPDGDGNVSRDEARRFLEIQFGLRRGDGKLLRLPSGRVVNYMLFLHADLNKNDKLEKAEFVERSYGDANVAKEFDSLRGCAFSTSESSWG